MIIIKFILNFMYRFLPEIDGVHELMQLGFIKEVSIKLCFKKTHI